MPLHRFRWRGVAVAACLLAAHVPVAVSAAPLVTTTFVLRRTSPGPTSFELQVSVWNDTRGSFIGHVGARVERGRVTLADALFSGSARRWEDTTVTAGGTRASTCQVGVCHDDDVEGYHGLGTIHDDPTGKDPLTHVFVTLVGRKVQYEFHAKGWKLVRMPLTFRYLDGGETSPAFSKVGQNGVEVYEDGTLPGGRGGSIALGIPPCSTSSSGLVPRGAGTLTLDGGVSSESITCPTERIFPASYAPKATTWRFHGRAAGDTTGRDTRLYVVDIPARLP